MNILAIPGVSEILVALAVGVIGKFFNVKAKKNTVTNILDLIGNNPLRETVKLVIRRVAKDLPLAGNNEKMQEAIKRVQRFIPDMMLSDDIVKALIESVYEEIKKELKEV